MPYQLPEHRHRFAVWAGARAAQRAFTSVENLRDALEQTSLRAFISQPASLRTNAEEFDRKHREWCNSIVEFLSERGVQNSTYGRAAKLVAVYMKSMVVIAGDGQSSLAAVAHPPIDRILLQNLASSADIASPHKARWRTTNWTMLDEHGYFGLLAELRTALPLPAPWWQLEKYWTVTNE